MNKVSKFFYLIWWKAIGEDIDTVKYMIKQRKEGKPILDPEKKKIAIEQLKAAPKALLKESWMWVLVVLFAFFLGMVIGEQFAVVKCNNFIYENFYDELMPGLPVVSPSIPMFPSNISQKDSEQEYQTKSSPMYPNWQAVP